MKLKNIKHLNIKQIASFTLFSICSVTFVVFALFFLVGYNMPSLFNNGVNEPMFTNTLLYLSYIVVALAIVVGVWAIVRELLIATNSQGIKNGINLKKIRYIVFAILVFGLILFYVTSSSKAIKINGVVFSDVFWLKVSEMFILLSYLLLSIAIAIAIWGAIKIYKQR